MGYSIFDQISNIEDPALLKKIIRLCKVMLEEMEEEEENEEDY